MPDREQPERDNKTAVGTPKFAGKEHRTSRNTTPRRQAAQEQKQGNGQAKPRRLNAAFTFYPNEPPPETQNVFQLPVLPTKKLATAKRNAKANVNRSFLVNQKADLETDQCRKLPAVDYKQIHTYNHKQKHKQPATMSPRKQTQQSIEREKDDEVSDANHLNAHRGTDMTVAEELVPHYSRSNAQLTKHNAISMQLVSARRQPSAITAAKPSEESEDVKELLRLQRMARHLQAQVLGFLNHRQPRKSPPDTHK